ncbi:MAG: alpha/beta hydrolase [Alphaproteobacteria bacterium]|nr:alpha/beta hydrolase [Alphaproteobacteria bacterium]
MDRRTVLIGLGAMAGAGDIGAAADGGYVEELGAMPSRLIGADAVTVWLPPGYAGGNGRCGVLYMQDGQNLFDPARAYGGVAWRVDAVIAQLMAANAIRPLIVVGIANLGKDRPRQYTPEAVHDRLSTAWRERWDREWGGPPFSNAYLKFMVDELKPVIDRRYRTLAGPGDTLVMGSSMGGLISLYALAEYPQVFGRAGCLSTHWPLFLPAPEDFAKPRSSLPYESEAIGAMRDYLQSKLGPPQGRKLWFDRGTATLDAEYAPYQTAVDLELAQLGWQRGRDFESRVYPGAEHNETSWHARLADPLRFLCA